MATTSIVLGAPNSSGIVIAAGQTATQTVNLTNNVFGTCLQIIINIASVSGGTVTVAVNGVSAQGYVYPLLTSTALNSTGTIVLRIGKGLTAAANLTSPDITPLNLQVVATVSGTINYGIDYNLGY